MIKTLSKVIVFAGIVITLVIISNFSDTPTLVSEPVLEKTFSAYTTQTPTHIAIHSDDDVITFNKAPISFNEKVVYVEKGNVIVYSNSASTTVASYAPNEMIYDLQVSPLRGYISFSHWNEKNDGCSGPWCFANSTHLVILGFKNGMYKTLYEFSEEGKVFGDVSWSPDDRYIAYKAGESLEVREGGSGKLFLVIILKKIIR